MLVEEGIKIVETLGTVGALAAGCGWLLWKVIKHQQERIEELYQIIIKLIDKTNKVDDNVLEIKASNKALIDYMTSKKD